MQALREARRCLDVDSEHAIDCRSDHRNVARHGGVECQAGVRRLTCENWTASGIIVKFDSRGRTAEIGSKQQPQPASPFDEATSVAATAVTRRPPLFIRREQRPERRQQIFPAGLKIAPVQIDLPRRRPPRRPYSARVADHGCTALRPRHYGVDNLEAGTLVRRPEGRLEIRVEFRGIGNAIDAVAVVAVVLAVDGIGK
jgi:hypothetical protein